MKKIYYSILSIVIATSFVSYNTWGQTTFSYTGAVQTYVVPAGVTTIQIEAWGAEGGSATNNSTPDMGGDGGFAMGELTVTPGETLEIYVGGMGGAGNAGGWNGGGVGSITTTTSTGGGASDVRVSPYGLNERVIVAGGGGGAEWSGGGAQAGQGGGLTGGPNGGGDNGANSGGPGTQVAGGTPSAFPAGFGFGGDGNAIHSGGGGGGYYGGGGGLVDGHGGGGSSYLGGVTAGTTTPGLRMGDGEIIITVLCSAISITPDLAVLPDESAMCSITPTTPTATNNCGAVVNGVPDVVFPLTTIGTTVVTWTYDDGAGNVTTQTQNVIVNGPDVSVTVTGAMIQSNEVVAAYQWLDCDNAYAVIPGEVNQNFTPSVTGNYAVEVTKGGCTDTSACTLIDFTDIPDYELVDLKVYPNPTNGQLNIEYPGGFNYIIYNNLGQVIITDEGEILKQIDLSSLNAGYYTVKVISGSNSSVIQIVKK